MAERVDLEFAKSEAAIGNRALVEFGLAVGVRASLGHTSMRVPGDPDRFVVKGRGYRIDVLSRMRPEDMILCDLEGNWLDGPAYTSQCSEVKIHSCIYKARPDVVSVTHVHPDHAVLLSVLQKRLRPMAQEGARLVIDPIPVFPKTRIITSDADGTAVAEMLGDGAAMLLLGHGAITVSTSSVEECVLNMALLEHQARLNYMAMCASGMDHPYVPDDLASVVDNRIPGESPHLELRRKAIPQRAASNQSGLMIRTGGGIWPDLVERINGDW